jgi:hypothetical protein
LLFAEPSDEPSDVCVGHITCDASSREHARQLAVQELGDPQLNGWYAVVLHGATIDKWVREDNEEAGDE